MTPSTPAQRLEQVIRTYIQACNDGDEKAIAACFVAEAVHYFPSLPKWVGAATIGSNFARRVREQGHSWTLDQFVIDADQCAATLEWTRFDGQGRILRGVDWFVFEPQTLRIREVGPYTAAPIHSDATRQELTDFEYAKRGYPTAPSARPTRGRA
jgi:methyltransferase